MDFSAPPQSAPLHRCDYCFAPAGPDLKLRRCGGCHIFYCSKECQKAHWPYHKATCRRLSRRDSNVAPHDGQYSSEVVQTLDGFLKAHNWALETAAKALAVGLFGSNYIDHLSDVISLFVFEPNATTDGSRRDPSRSFRLVDVRLSGADAWSQPGHTAAETVEALAAIRRNALEHFVRQGPRRTPVGVLLVVYSIRGEPTVNWQCFPQYEPRGIIPPPPIRNRDTARQVKDLISLCTASIDGGYPFRPIHGSTLAFPGKYTHTRRQWTWEPLFTSWEEYLQHRANYPALTALDGLRSGCTPDQLMFLLSLY